MAVRRGKAALSHIVETDRILSKRYSRVAIYPIGLPARTSAMDDPSAPIRRDQWLVPGPDLGGLIDLQGIVPDAGVVTQERSPSHAGPATCAQLHTSATQNEPRPPRFLWLGGDRQETESDKGPAQVICYDLELRLRKNKRTEVVDTERKLRVAPSMHWEQILHKKVDVIRSQKDLEDTQATVVDRNVIVSLTGRPSAKVQKHFKGLDIDWSFAEEEMTTWARHLRSHQNLKVELVINLKANEPLTTSLTKRKEVGRSSATTRMLAERNEGLRTEAQISRHMAGRLDKIRSIRCVDTTCRNQGQWCRVDQNTGQHHPARSQDIHQLSRLDLSSSRDAPNKRQADQAGNNVSKKRRHGPLEITRRCPVSLRASSPSAQGSIASPLAPFTRRSISKLPTGDILKLFGLEGRDPVKLLPQYGAWMLGQSDDARWPKASRKAEEVAMELTLDVVQIDFKLGHKALVDEGVAIGTALRWEEYVLPWLQEHARTPTSPLEIEA